VWNATGTNNGVPYVESLAPVPAGGSRDFLIQYYVPNPRVVPTNTLTAVVNLTSPFNAVVFLEQPLPLTTDAFCVEFSSQSGRIYYVKRTEDFVHWTTVSGPIIGTGQHIQWFDSAPRGNRFYRVMRLP
jgi:hypothetical protein